MIITAILAFLIFFLFHNLALKNFYKKFKQYARYKNGFYECGFRPRQHVSSQLTLSGYFSIAVTLLYEIEGLFMLVFLFGVPTASVLDFCMIAYYILFFVLGIFSDAYLGTIDWRIY